MKVTLPVKIRDELKDGKRILEYSEKDFELDLSLAAQMRWEAKFPEQAQIEDLANYIMRINEQKDLSTSVVLSKIKALYCCFDTDINFINFLKLFDFSSKEYIDKLTNKLTEIFEAIKNEAAEKNS